jgi:hypothetical protein
MCKSELQDGGLPERGLTGVVRGVVALATVHAKAAGSAPQEGMQRSPSWWVTSLTCIVPGHRATFVPDRSAGGSRSCVRDAPLNEIVAMVLAAAWLGAVEHVRRARAISESEVVDHARSDRGYRPPSPLT